MIKKSIYIALWIFSSIFGGAIANAETQAEGSNWIKYGNGFSGDARGIGVDKDGNIYVGGFSNSQIEEQTKYGYHAYYIAKYIPDGDELWFVRGGAANSKKHGSTYGYDIAVDSDGNSYITGTTDIGLSNQKQISAKDYFIAKYNANGKLKWSRQNGVKLSKAQLKAHLISVSQTNSIGVDDGGNSYVTGNSYLASINNASSKVDLKSEIEPVCFIAKYSSDGTLQWQREFTPDETCVDAKKIRVDSVGNSYVTGIVHEGTTNEDRRINYFVAKYNTEGQLIWFTKAPEVQGVKPRDDEAYPNTVATGIGFDIDGNSYVSGYTNVGIKSDSSLNGLISGFVAKYDQYGNPEWIEQIGAAEKTVHAMGIWVDNAGDSYVVGSTNIDLSGKGEDAVRGYFIAKFAPDGKQILIRKGHFNKGTTLGRAIVVDNNEIIYTTGLLNLHTNDGYEANSFYYITKSKE